MKKIIFFTAKKMNDIPTIKIAKRNFEFFILLQF